MRRDEKIESTKRLTPHHLLTSKDFVTPKKIEHYRNAIENYIALLHDSQPASKTAQSKTISVEQRAAKLLLSFLHTHTSDATNSLIGLTPATRSVSPSKTVVSINIEHSTINRMSAYNTATLADVSFLFLLISTVLLQSTSLLK